MNEEEKIIELHKIVVTGIVNGLSHTYRDGRLEEIDFWRKRSQLFNSFSLCIMNMIWGNDYDLDEKELKRIAEEGYKK